MGTWGCFACMNYWGVGYFNRVVWLKEFLGVTSWLKPTVSIRRLWSYDDFMTRHRVRLDCDWGTGWVVCFSFKLLCVLSRGVGMVSSYGWAGIWARVLV